MSRSYDPTGGVTAGPTTDVTPVNLVKRGGDFEDEREALNKALVEAMSALAELGPFWGDDENGQLFYAGADGSKGYKAARDELVGHVMNIATAYGSIGEKLALSGVNVAAAEWASIAATARAVYQGDLAVPTTKAKVV